MSKNSTAVCARPLTAGYPPGGRGVPVRPFRVRPPPMDRLGVDSGSSSPSRAPTTAGRCTDSHVADGFTARRLTFTVRRASESDTPRPITRASCSHQPSLPARALRRSPGPAPSQPGSPRQAIDPLVGHQWSSRHRFGAERVNGDRRGSVAAPTNDGADGGSPNAGLAGITGPLRLPVCRRLPGGHRGRCPPNAHPSARRSKSPCNSTRAPPLGRATISWFEGAEYCHRRTEWCARTGDFGPNLPH